MSPLGKRIVVFTMFWVLFVMVASQVYDNVTGRGMPAVREAAPTARAGITPDAGVSKLAGLQSCVAANPNNLQCVRDLAELYYAADQWPQAQTNFERAVQLDPHNVELLLRLAGTYIYQQQFDRAAPTLEQAGTIRPDSPEIHLLLGLSFSKLDPPNIDRAIEEWQSVVRLAPGSKWAQQAQIYLDEVAR